MIAETGPRRARACRHGGRHQHGDYTMYQDDGCRCYACAATMSRYLADRAKAKTAGTWQPYVDAAPARAHVQALHAAGLNIATIARAAGSKRDTVSRMVNGSGDGTPSPARIRSTLAARLLAVRAGTAQASVPDGMVVCGVGTVRRLRALAVKGWTQTYLAARLGRTRGAMSKLIHGERVTAGTARAVAVLYDELWAVEPPPGWIGDRSARRAVAAGWAPPGAWDDNTIDDPAARPDYGPSPKRGRSA